MKSLSKLLKSSISTEHTVDDYVVAGGNFIYKIIEIHPKFRVQSVFRKNHSTGGWSPYDGHVMTVNPNHNKKINLYEYLKNTDLK